MGEPGIVNPNYFGGDKQTFVVRMVTNDGDAMFHNISSGQTFPIFPKISIGDTILTMKMSVSIVLDKEKVRARGRQDEVLERVFIILKLEEVPPQCNNVINGTARITVWRRPNEYCFKAGKLGPEGLTNFATEKPRYGIVIRHRPSPMFNSRTTGNVTVRVELKISPISYTPGGIIRTEEDFKKSFVDKLGMDFARIVDTQPIQSRSVKLISWDNIEIEARSAILSARSHVFQALLESGMQESLTGVVRIPDISGRTLKILLRFMNFAKLDDDWASPEVIIELVNAANKYCLSDLLEFLDEFVGKRFPAVVAKDLIQVTSLIGLKKAENDISNWMAENQEAVLEMANLD